MTPPGGSDSHAPMSWVAFGLLAMAVAWLWLIRTLERLVVELARELKLLLDRSDSP